MSVEFLGIAATNDGSETTPRSGGAFDKDYTLASGYNVQGTLALLSLNYVPVR